MRFPNAFSKIPRMATSSLSTRRPVIAVFRKRLSPTHGGPLPADASRWISPTLLHRSSEIIKIRRLIIDTKNYLGPRPYSDFFERPTCTHYGKRNIFLFLFFCWRSRSGITHTFVMSVCPLQSLSFRLRCLWNVQASCLVKRAPTCDSGVSSLSDALFLDTLQKDVYVLFSGLRMSVRPAKWCYFWSRRWRDVCWVWVPFSYCFSLWSL